MELLRRKTAAAMGRFAEFFYVATEGETSNLPALNIIRTPVVELARLGLGCVVSGTGMFHDQGGGLQAARQEVHERMAAAPGYGQLIVQNYFETVPGAADPEASILITPLGTQESFRADLPRCIPYKHRVWDGHATMGDLNYVAAEAKRVERELGLLLSDATNPDLNPRLAAMWPPEQAAA